MQKSKKVDIFIVVTFSVLVVLLLLGMVWGVFWFFLEKTKDEEGPKSIITLVLDVDTGTVNSNDKKKVIEQTVRVIKNRIDPTDIGDVEFKISDNRITVKLVNAKDIDKIKRRIATTAFLEFCLVNEKPENLSNARLGEKIPGFRLVRFMNSRTGRNADEQDLLIKKESELTGKYLEKVNVAFGGNYNEPMVAIKFNKKGSKIFEFITKEYKGKRLAIIIDGQVISAPVIKSAIKGGEGVISGNMTVEQAKEVALLLSSGALPAPVQILSETHEVKE